MAVGAAGALTDGANEPRFFFSVGATAGAVLAGFSSFFSELQAASAPEHATAAAAAIRAARLATSEVFIVDRLLRGI